MTISNGGLSYLKKHFLKSIIFNVFFLNRFIIFSHNGIYCKTVL